MKLTIIPADGVVVVDDQPFGDIDLSFIDSSISAIQWDGEAGEIERKDTKGKITQNEEFTDISPYQAAVDLWQAKKLVDDAQPPTDFVTE